LWCSRSEALALRVEGRRLADLGRHEPAEGLDVEPGAGAAEHERQVGQGDGLPDRVPVAAAPHTAHDFRVGDDRLAAVEDAGVAVQHEGDELLTETPVLEPEKGVPTDEVPVG